MPHVVVHMGCITPWLLAHGCVLWQGSLPPLARVWSPRPDLPIVAMTPCHVLSSLGAATSNDIAHMTPHPRTRHCAFMHSIPHHVLSQFCCCCIVILHPSNKPWQDSSSCLAQGLPHVSCSCRRLCTEAPWFGHAYATLSHLLPPPSLKSISGCFRGFWRAVLDVSGGVSRMQEEE